MRILTVCERLFPDTSGGPSLSIYAHNKYLSLNGIQITTLTTAFGIPGNLRDRWIENELGKVIYLKQLFHSFPLRLIIRAASEVKKADIVHVNSFFYPSSVCTAFFAFLHRKKIVWSVHGELDDYCLTLKPLKKKVFLLLVRPFVRKLAVFHVASDMEEVYVQKHLGKNIKTIKIPCLIECNYPASPAITEPYFLYIGRFHVKKGIDLLIQAIWQSALFLKSGYILKLAGDYKNEYGEKIVKLIAKAGLSAKIKLIGPVAGIEKDALYKGAYFTIMPSITENFGMVVAESLSFGTPVITTTGTPWNILKENRCGYYVEATSRALCEAIESAIKLPGQDYMACRANSRETVVNHFDITTRIGDWIKRYKSLLQ